MIDASYLYQKSLLLLLQCDLGSQSSPSTLQWIASHPLMHESVPNHGNPLPVFDLTRADYRLTQIMVHSHKAVDKDYQVLFLGTGEWEHVTASVRTYMFLASQSVQILFAINGKNQS